MTMTCLFVRNTYKYTGDGCIMVINIVVFLPGRVRCLYAGFHTGEGGYTKIPRPTISPHIFFSFHYKVQTTILYKI